VSTAQPFWQAVPAELHGSLPHDVTTAGGHVAVPSQKATEVALGGDPEQLGLRHCTVPAGTGV